MYFSSLSAGTPRSELAELVPALALCVKRARAAVAVAKLPPLVEATVAISTAVASAAHVDSAVGTAVTTAAAAGDASAVLAAQRAAALASAVARRAARPAVPGTSAAGSAEQEWAYTKEWATAVEAKLSQFVEMLSSVPEATPHLLRVLSDGLKKAVDKAHFTVKIGEYAYDRERKNRQQRQAVQKRALVLLSLLQVALRSWAKEPNTKLKLAEIELAMSRVILEVRTPRHECTRFWAVDWPCAVRVPLKTCFVVVAVSKKSCSAKSAGRICRSTRVLVAARSFLPPTYSGMPGTLLSAAGTPARWHS